MSSAKYYDATKEFQPFQRTAQPPKEHPNKRAARAKRRALELEARRNG